MDNMIFPGCEDVTSIEQALQCMRGLVVHVGKDNSPAILSAVLPKKKKIQTVRNLLQVTLIKGLNIDQMAA